MIFSSSTTHPPTRHLHQQQTLGIRCFIQAWNILSWAGVTEFVNLNSQLFLVLQAETTKPKKYYYFHACIDVSLALH